MHTRHSKWKPNTKGSHIAHIRAVCKVSMSKALGMQRKVRIQIKVITIHPHSNGKSGAVLLSTPFIKLKSLCSCKSEEGQQASTHVKVIHLFNQFWIMGLLDTWIMQDNVSETILWFLAVSYTFQASYHLR